MCVGSRDLVNEGGDTHAQLDPEVWERSWKHELCTEEVQVLPITSTHEQYVQRQVDETNALGVSRFI